jgi:hypothetical protein
MQNTVKVHDIRIRIKNVRETKSGKIEITTIHGKPWNEGCFHEADRRDNRRNDDCAEGDGEKEDLHSILIHETTAAEDVGEEVLKHATEGDAGAEDFMVTMATKLNKGSKLYAFATLSMETWKLQKRSRRRRSSKWELTCAE